jgi:hypothetical protein
MAEACVMLALRGFPVFELDPFSLSLSLALSLLVSLLIRSPTSILSPLHHVVVGVWCGSVYFTGRLLHFTSDWKFTFELRFPGIHMQYWAGSLYQSHAISSFPHLFSISDYISAHILFLFVALVCKYSTDLCLSCTVYISLWLIYDSVFVVC